MASSSSFDVYKNFIIKKIEHSHANLDSSGNGTSLIYSKQSPNFTIKSLESGQNIDIIDNKETIIINALTNIQKGVGNKLLILDEHNNIKYMKCEKIYGSLFFIGNMEITSLTKDIWSDIIHSGYQLSSEVSNIEQSSIVEGCVNINPDIDDFVGIILCNIV